MQLGDGVGSISKDFTPSRQLRRRIDGVRQQHADQQAAGVLGDIGEGEPAFSLGCLTAASGQEPAEPAITMSVHRPEQDGAGIVHRDFGSDDQLEAGLLGRDVSTDHARQTVPIGDGHPGIAQHGRPGRRARRDATLLPGRRSSSCNEARHTAPRVPAAAG